MKCTTRLGMKEGEEGGGEKRGGEDSAKCQRALGNGTNPASMSELGVEDTAKTKKTESDSDVGTCKSGFALSFFSERWKRTEMTYD